MVGGVAQWSFHFPTYAVQVAVLCDSTNIYRRKAAVVLRKVAECLRFDCAQCGSSSLSLQFAVYLRFPAVFCGCAEKLSFIGKPTRLTKSLLSPRDR